MFNILLTKNNCSDTIDVSKEQMFRGMIRMKRYRVKNKFRFTVFMVTVLLLMSALFSYVTGMADVEGEPVEKFETIQIYSGDTMWTIAENYKPEKMDIRDYVNMICRENDLKAGDLVEGQIIKVPVMN